MIEAERSDASRQKYGTGSIRKQRIMKQLEIKDMERQQEKLAVA